ncbi:MAG TPA: sigma-70 family RNA polymerase sigma factor, partial [Candidatus Wallbacteria bacterium]|nr:sigma-70 family RNA polymerase sigma factor [Candidatus Wallbacteria bacterium]
MDPSTGLIPETDRKETSDNIELTGNPEPKALLLSEGEAELWIELKKSRDVKIREKLILKYAHFVKYVAGRIKMHLPDHIEFEDLVSWGTFGLINAVDKYDIEMNIKFVTYSTKRIRGAIIDGLRLLDWVPRGIRSQAKQLNTAMIELEMKLGREPNEAELCAYMKIGPEDLEKIYEEENKSFVMSLDEICVEDGGGEISSKYQLVENLAAKNPELSIESSQVKEIVV